MDINNYFALIKKSKQEYQEYENILEEIDKLRIKAKKNTTLQKSCLTMVLMDY